MPTNEDLKSRPCEGKENQNQTKTKQKDTVEEGNLKIPTFLNTETHTNTHTHSHSVHTQRHIHIKISKIIAVCSMRH